MRRENHVIDLHMHSVHSDGTFTTQDLLNMLWDKDVDIFSFTDHDSIGCYQDLEQGKARLYSGVTLIPGVELTCQVGGELRDMLGYGIDVSVIAEYLDRKYSPENRIRKQQLVLERFKEICRKKHLTFDESITANEGKKAEGYTVMFMELNRHPENIAKYPFLNDATRLYWDHFTNPESEFFVDETFDLPDFEEAIRVIHQAGGMAFVAHPYVYGLSDRDTEALVRFAADKGADGMELKHQSNREGHVEKLRRIAEKYQLYLSGGTDFHGYNKPGIKLVTAYGNMQMDFRDMEPWFGLVKKVEA
ncbi:MAG: PHP domain-containing protein [Parasporobacterium sp.]|nr:PHP domain-containing protein [Parasporobacterium sp.]